MSVTNTRIDPQELRASTHPATGFATTVETAQFLRISKAMVHKLIERGKMPACRYGRVVRIPLSWLEAQGIVPMELNQQTPSE